MNFKIRSNKKGIEPELVMRRCNTCQEMAALTVIRPFIPVWAGQCRCGQLIIYGQKTLSQMVSNLITGKDE